jgi:hypothetical protein
VDSLEIVADAPQPSAYRDISRQVLEGEVSVGWPRHPALHWRIEWSITLDGYLTICRLRGT